MISMHEEYVMEKLILQYLGQELRKRALHNLNKTDGTSFYEKVTEMRVDAINENTQIIVDGVVDSFGLVGLRSWIEKKFDVHIPDERVTVESFATIKKIVQLVKELN